MSDMQVIETTPSPTTDDYELMQQLDALLGVAATPNLPAALVLRVLDTVWLLLGGSGQPASEP